MKSKIDKKELLLWVIAIVLLAIIIAVPFYQEFHPTTAQYPIDNTIIQVRAILKKDKLLSDIEVHYNDEIITQEHIEMTLEEAFENNLIIRKFSYMSSWNYPYSPLPDEIVKYYLENK